MGRSQVYYAQLAGACNSLIAQSRMGANGELRLPGTNETLPPLIRDLHPANVLVKTNGVLIRIGEGRGGYGITWYSEDTAAGLWQLETFAEGTRRVVFSSPIRPPKLYVPGK